MPLFRPSELFAFLNESGLRPKKHLSQNFLIDGNIIRKIVNVAHVQAGDLIVEIGPGPGALTEALLAAGVRVMAIEKDAAFASLLPRLQTADNRLEIFQEDALSFELEKHLKGRAKILSNVPYHITTPLIASLLPLKHCVSSLILMVQKEVAERMCAKKSTPEYSSFSLFVQYYATPTYCFTVEPTCFSPKPSVHSAVIKLDLKSALPLTDPAPFFRIVRAAFQKRRKMLRSSLKDLLGAAVVEKTLIQMGLSPLSRPEELSLEEWLTFWRFLNPG